MESETKEWQEPIGKNSIVRQIVGASVERAQRTSRDAEEAHRRTRVKEAPARKVTSAHGEDVT